MGFPDKISDLSFQARYQKLLHETEKLASEIRELSDSDESVCPLSGTTRFILAVASN